MRLRALALLLLLLLAGCARPLEKPAAQPIAVDGEAYTAPTDVTTWIKTPHEVIWVAPGDPPILRATPRRAGGGALVEGARDLARMPKLPVIAMEAAGDWVSYTTQSGVNYSLWLVSLRNPQGSIMVGAVSVGEGGRFLSALSPNYAAWQAYTPAGPGKRYMLGKTHVFRMEPQAEWDLPEAGWAESLHIENEGLVLALPGGKSERYTLRRPAVTPGQDTLMTWADFDRNGLADEVQGTLVAQDYRHIRVGGLLDLPETQGVLDVWAVELGGSYPVLILGNRGGSGGQGLNAYAYSPEQRRMVRLNWGERESEFGFASLDRSTQTVIVGHRTHDYVDHMDYVAYAFQNGRLEPQDRWYGPGPEQLSYPSDPTFVLLVAFTSVTMTLPAETPRYFADRAEAERFYQAVQALGAQEGVPWTLPGSQGVPTEGPFEVQAPDGKGGQITVGGQVSFARRDGRHVIQEVQFTR